MLQMNYGEFLWQVLIPIFIWLLLVLTFLIILFVKYTFGNWSKENPNPYQDETFGMPRGTFRGILTLTLLYVAVILEIVNVRAVGFEQEIHDFMVAFQMMIAFYFGAKVMHHITSTDKKKAYAMARAIESQSATDLYAGDFENYPVEEDNPATGGDDIEPDPNAKG